MKNSEINSEKLITALKWRYATKRMTGEKVPQEKLENILEALRLSASSMGIQPYTIILIENPSLKEKLQPLAYNQPQIIESSHLLVFAVWDDVTPENINKFIEEIAHTRNVAIESLDGFKTSILNSYRGKTKEEKYESSAQQAFIALGTALAAAAMEEVDATPMGGFQPAAMDEILGLRKKGLRSVVLLALGYRDTQNDYLANAKKVRRDREKLILDLESVQ